jgi:DNA polymerase III subunit delta
MSAEKILSDLKKKNYKALYWLEGEEPFFIDQVIDFAEKKILPESEASFNLSVFYGRDADWGNVVNACMRYPMFAEKQVVILKEAQYMKDIEMLENYISNPLTSTILFIAYKEKKIDARTKFSKLIKEKGELLTTKKLYDSQMPEWTATYIASSGLGINQKALALLTDHIGTDLGRMANEIDKLSINLGERKTITEDDIEQYIGISKEFNVFELQEAIARKDLAKAIRIIQYFGANPKAGPVQFILPTLYGFFSKIYSLYSKKDVSEYSVRPLFFNNPITTKNALHAMTVYGFSGIEKILLLLNYYNLRSIGVHDTGTAGDELMKEMVVKIMS